MWTDRYGSVRNQVSAFAWRIPALSRPDGEPAACLCRLLLLAVLLSLCVGGGCVRRRMTIRSQPPGAQVFIDDQEIGVTPVSTSYTYYGTRKIQLIKDGFETLTVQQNFHPSWYSVPPLDFFSENLYSGELRDERVLDFQLIPQRIVPIDELLDRASTLRVNSRQGVTIPLGPPEPYSPYVPQMTPSAMPPATNPSAPGFTPFSSLDPLTRLWKSR